MAGNTIIQIKRSSSSATPTSLAAGELAYSYSSNNLFIGLSDGTPVNIGGVSTLVKLQAAYDAANAAVGGTAADGWAREQANASFAHANSAYDEANSAYTYAGTVETYAQAAYGLANTTTTYAETGFAHANSAYDEANSAYSYAGTVDIYAQAAYVQANTTQIYSETGFAHANAAYDAANTAYTNAGNVEVYAQSGFAHANASYDQANTATTSAQAAFDAANNVVSSFDITGDSGTDTFSTGETLTFTGGDGVTTAITDNTVTIDVDNTVIRTTGGQTISGSLAITGDLIVSGNTVTQDVSTITVEDSLIQLAANNNVADSLDIGFFGEYNSGGLKYTTLMRDATDGKYKLLVAGTEKPDAANTVNVAAYSTGTLVANIEAGSVVADSLTVNDLAYFETLVSTQGYMVVDATTGIVSYTYNVDGGSF